LHFLSYLAGEKRTFKTGYTKGLINHLFYFVYMKRKRIIYVAFLFIFLSLGFLSSCKKEHPDLNLLHAAQNIVIENPDSALIYLDSIREPDKMEKEAYMKYYVTLVQAKQKTRKSIAKDSLIFEAVKYLTIYSGNNNEKATANLYAACVLIENEKYSKAMDYLLRANSFANETDNDRLKALIKSRMGLTFYSENLTDSAASCYKQAFKIYLGIEGEENNQMATAYQTAVNLNIGEQYEESLIYGEKGLAIAQKKENLEFQKIFLKNISINYRENKMPRKAIKPLLTALEIDTTNDPSILLNLSKCYHELYKNDSTLYYGEKTWESLDKQAKKNLYTELSTNKHLASVYEANKEYKKALKHHKLYNEAQQDIKNNSRSGDLLEIEKKYNLAEKEKELVKSKLHEQILLSISLATILLLVVAALLIVIIRNKHNKAKQKNILLDKQIESVLFVNNLYKYVTSESSAFEKQVDALTHNYTVKEKSKSPGYETIQDMLKSMKKQSQEKLHESSLKFLRDQSINSKIIDLLKGNTSDLLLVSLSICHYEFKHIATLLGVSTNALHMRRQRLRDKLKNAGIPSFEIEKTLRANINQE